MFDRLPTGSIGRERIGLCFVVFAAIGFGVSPAFAKLAYYGGCEPLTLVSARFTICFVALFLVARARGCALRITGRLTIVPLVMGPLLTWNAAGYLSAVKEVEVGLAAALFYTFPLQVAVFSWLLGFGGLNTRRIVALGLGFTGAVTVISYGISGTNLYGIVLALLAGCGVALSSIYFSKVANPKNSISLMVSSMLVACTLSWCLTFAFDDFSLPQSGEGWTGFMVSSFGFSFALMAYYLALPLVGAIRAAIVANMEPLVAVLIAALILNERLEYVQLLGIFLIVTAVYMGGQNKPQAGA